MIIKDIDRYLKQNSCNQLHYPSSAADFPQ